MQACATAAGMRGEFVRRMRRQGVLVRARYAEGTQDVITGARSGTAVGTWRGT